jgi:hypothetical protein
VDKTFPASHVILVNGSFEVTAETLMHRINALQHVRSGGMDSFYLSAAARHMDQALTEHSQRGAALQDASTYVRATEDGKSCVETLLSSLSELTPGELVLLGQQPV